MADFALIDYSEAVNPQRPQFLTVTFHFSDGVTPITYTEPNVPDQAAIPKLAADWLRQFNKIKAQAAAPLSLLVVQDAVAAILAPPSPPPEPTAEQIALEAFLVLRDDWQARAFEVGAGVVENPAARDLAYDKMKAAYLPEYHPFLKGLF